MHRSHQLGSFKLIPLCFIGQGKNTLPSVTALLVFARFLASFAYVQCATLHSTLVSLLSYLGKSGHVSALVSDGACVFVGTSKGCLLKYTTGIVLVQLLHSQLLRADRNCVGVRRLPKRRFRAQSRSSKLIIVVVVGVCKSSRPQQ